METDNPQNQDFKKNENSAMKYAGKKLERLDVMTEGMTNYSSWR